MAASVDCEVWYLLVTIRSWSSLQRISGLDATRMDPSACKYTMYGEGLTTRNALQAPSSQSTMLCFALLANRGHRYGHHNQKSGVLQLIQTDDS